MQLHWLLPDVKGIPVLMYHRIWPRQRDGLTLTPEDLRAQWTHLRDAGYTCLTMERFLKIMRGSERVPKKAFLLTFDDGYRNNLTYALPLLEEFGWEATIFIIAGTLDSQYPMGEGVDEKLSVEELRKMIESGHVRLGLHGYRHENFSETSLKDIREALQQGIKAFETAGLAFMPVLAYPYGARPEGEGLIQFKKRLSALGLKAAFRIGNKPQTVPTGDVYELRRIDIRGEDSLEDFQIKLRKGKLKPF